MSKFLHHVYVFASTRSGKSRAITPELIDSLFESGAISFAGDSQKLSNEDIPLNHCEVDDCAVILDEIELNRKIFTKIGKSLCRKPLI